MSIHFWQDILMECEWDDSKNRANLEKHSISFELAQEIFQGTFISKIDNRRDYGETRLLALGILGFVLLAVYTMRGEKVRIILARRANEKERSVYYGHITRGATEDPGSDEGF